MRCARSATRAGRRRGIPVSSARHTTCMHTSTVQYCTSLHPCARRGGASTVGEDVRTCREGEHVLVSRTCDVAIARTSHRTTRMSWPRSLKVCCGKLGEMSGKRVVAGDGAVPMPDARARARRRPESRVAVAIGRRLPDAASAKRCTSVRALPLRRRSTPSNTVTSHSPVRR